MRALRYAFDEAVASLWRGRQVGPALDGDDRAGAVRARRLPARDVEPRAARRRVEQRGRDVRVPERRRDADERRGDRARCWRRATSSARTSSSRRPTRSRGSSRRSPTWRRPWTALGRQPAAGVLRSAAAARAAARAPASTRSARGCGRCRAWPTCATTASGSTGCCRRQRHPRRRPRARRRPDVAAALTVANVVRLALYARRDEIEIMQLVGAPQAYIRGPFVMEGVLQGGIGALVALAGPGASPSWRCARRYLVPLASALNLSSVRFLPLELCVAAGRRRHGGRVPRRAGGGVEPRERALQNLDSCFRGGTTLRSSRGQFISRTCMPRFVTDSRPISAQHPLTEFYREEFLKHHRCLQQQRPYYSESAITTSKPRSPESWASSNNSPRKTTPPNWSAPSSRSSTSSPASRPGPIPSTPTDAFTRTIFDTISWPSSGPASLRPTPGALVGARARPADRRSRRPDALSASSRPARRRRRMARRRAACLAAARRARGLVIAPASCAERRAAGVRAASSAAIRCRPRRASAAGRRALELAAALAPDERLLVLLSGGASALMAVPGRRPDARGQARDDASACCGRAPTSTRSTPCASTCRRSRAAGSRRRAGGCRDASRSPTSSATISSVIASGPTVADASTLRGRARRARALRRASTRYPAAVVARLRRGARGDACPRRPSRATRAWRGADARSSAAGATRWRGARGRGARARLSRRCGSTTGRRRGADGRRRASARRAVRARPALGRPACIVSSGETTVHVTGRGQGRPEPGVRARGRRARWRALGGRGVVGQRRHRRHRRPDRRGRRRRRLDDARPGRARPACAPAAFLDDNNAYAFFDALGDLIHTGPTGTNVGDLQVILLA